MQPLPKLGPWRDDLDRLLTENEGRAACERLTLIRIFEALRALGYEDGYDAVRRYARGRQRERSSSSAAAELRSGRGLPVRLQPRRRDPAPPITIMTPEALRLAVEPTADCARYDTLRRAV